MKTGDLKEKLLVAAEKRARSGGYHGFSFRDLASDVGVKSASVHYHFPTKADLGEALARRYAETVGAHLGEGAAVAPEAAIARVVGVFRKAFTVDKTMCLCGLFGAERDVLPPQVAARVRDFFAMLMDYLAASFGEDWRGPPPAAIVAQLEGALILARNFEDPTLFDEAIRPLTAPN